MTDQEFQDRVQAEFYRPKTALDLLDPNMAYSAIVTGICYNKFVHSADVFVLVSLGPDNPDVVLHDLIGIPCVNQLGVAKAKTDIYLKLFAAKKTKQYPDYLSLANALNSLYKSQKDKYLHQLTIQPWKSKRGHWFFNIIDYKRVSK